MRLLTFVALAAFAAPARAEPPATAPASAPASAPAKANDDDDGPARFSLATESDRAAWLEPGFRLELGIAYGYLFGLGGAPGGRLLGPEVRAGVRLDQSWSLMATFEYLSASAAGGLSGLRYAGTLEPIWHVTPSLALGFGLGFGGIVEGRTNRPDADPPAGSLDNSYTLPDASTPLASCTGVGVTGLVRADYMLILGPRSSTGLALEVDGQWTGCVSDTGRVEPDTAVSIVRRQWWPDLGVSLAVVIFLALRARLVLLAVLLAPALARAQSEPATQPAESQPAALEPPVALTDTIIPYPTDAPPTTQPVAVRVKILVDATGAVQRVDLLAHTVPQFDDAVVAAARGFRFQPARYGGKPIPIEITFTHTFLPPPPTSQPSDGSEGPPLVSVLRGRLVTLGTRVPLARATVAAQVGERHYTADSDASGHFRLPLPAGDARISVHAAGYNAFLQEEHLAAEQELAVTYYVERERYDPYEIVVYGEQRRDEMTRITLRGPEIKQVPGTFGDPFRVIQTLPGVSSVISLLPFPVVRGASPSSTGFLLDGTRVPLLFHLLSGPSVIHPELIDEVQFYPGGAPVTYGGYTGGIVDGVTHRSRPDEHLIDVDANLLEAGGLVREPIAALGLNVTAAARYGYPGFVLGLATNQASLSYWDYQLRADGGNPRNGFTIFAFGARDELDTVSPTADPNDPNPPLLPTLILGFHRLDLRLNHGSGGLDGTYRVVFGYDETLSSGTNVSTWLIEPSATWRLKLDDALVFNAGLQGSARWFNQGAPPATTPDQLDLSVLTMDLHQLMVGSAYLEMLWRPTKRWLIRPGVRADVYTDRDTTKASIDPRVTVRYRVADRDLADAPAGSDDSAVWLKAAFGLYHQPPRFVLPLPGLDIMPLKYGLLSSYQSSLGAEVPLGNRISVEAEGYFSYLDPTIFDVSVNPQDLNNEANPSLIPTTTVPPETTVQEVIDRLLTPQVGRAYGLELLLRRQSKGSGLYGWISYTLSRSERQKDGVWVPYDFDRTHLLNLVAGLPLPRNWDVGVRFQYESGKPSTTTAGYNTARDDGYARIDLRIDKRAVWKSWLLDFYVDIANVALLPEEVTPGQTLHYVLPTLGVRGRF